MLRIFLDTSAFAKLYIEEYGSGEIGDLVRKADSLVVSAIVLPETLSALRRLVREGKITEADYGLVKERLCRDIADIEVVSISDETIGKAVAVIERSPIRTLDALHIGAALAEGGSLFVTADSRQAEAARAAGLEVRFAG
ncbi:MAG: type II toxin-antitoxin system VapC family toxin [Treponema sp.]|nr:type II toxin-antitoxin system VapC family toxin [Treponema sp.]